MAEDQPVKRGHGSISGTGLVLRVVINGRRFYLLERYLCKICRAFPSSSGHMLNTTMLLTSFPHNMTCSSLLNILSWQTLASRAPDCAELIGAFVSRGCRDNSKHERSSHTPVLNESSAGA